MTFDTDFNQVQIDVYYPPLIFIGFESVSFTCSCFSVDFLCALMTWHQSRLVNWMFASISVHLWWFTITKTRAKHGSGVCKKMRCSTAWESNSYAMRSIIHKKSADDATTVLSILTTGNFCHANAPHEYTLHTQKAGYPLYTNGRSVVIDLDIRSALKGDPHEYPL